MNTRNVDKIMASERMQSGDFVQEVIRTMDVNEMILSFRSDIHRVAMAYSHRNLHHRMLRDTGRITQDEYEELEARLREGVEDEKEGPILIQFPGLRSRIQNESA